MQKYSLNIAWSDEDEGFIATTPEFEGLASFGETYEEAVEEIQAAIEMAQELFIDEGRQLPEPVKLKQCSGNIRLRMPKSLHQRLATIAKTEGVSLNTLIVSQLSGSTTSVEQINQIKDALSRLSIQEPSSNYLDCGNASSSGSLLNSCIIKRETDAESNTLLKNLEYIEV